VAKEFGPLTDATNDFIVWDKPATDEPAGRKVLNRAAGATS
jgi:hypothetical protein